jgi:large subunit ribosomal protein L24e
VVKVLEFMKKREEVEAKRERVHYKTRMAGNKEREKEANRKLVAEHSHLLPKERASERMAREAEGEVEELPLEREKAKVFGKMQQRRRVLVDGGVEDEMDVDMD